jgi:hypothetical protein
MPKLTNEISLGATPVYCSACFGFDGTARHVDFDSACDRGYGEHGVSMDNLILCETCLKSGAELVDMIDATQQADRIASLEKRLADEQKRADRAAAYANRMEQAIAARPEPITVSRPRGRPVKQPETVGA